MIYNATWFYKTFKKNVTENKYEIEYRNNQADFTKSVTKEINEIIKSAGWEPQNEYYRIDAIGWQTRYKEAGTSKNDYGLNPHLWDLKIAVEHENSKTDWTDELIKLAYIKCPVKVIICYNYCDCREKGNCLRSDKSKLTFAYQCLYKLKEYARPRTDEELLIIIGNAAPFEGNITYRDFDYKGYLLKQDGFHIINEEGCEE